MSPKTLTAFRLDPEIRAGLKALKARDGMPEAEAVRRAIGEFLRKKGVLKTPARKRQR